MEEDERPMCYISGESLVLVGSCEPGLTPEV